jgi:protein Mpv17
MLLFKTKAASRAVLRKPPSKNTQTNLARRHNSTNTTPKTKTGEETANTSVPVANVVAPLPLWQRFGLLSRGIEAYGRNQQKRPLRTQFITSLVIYTLGDLSAQNINGDEYNPTRTLRALVISAFSSIPSYKWLVLLVS